MKYEKLEGSYVKASFEVTADEFDKGLAVAFDKVKGNVEIPGFRKGHVTRQMFENKYGVEALYEEAINHCISEKYNEIFECKELEIVAQPKIDFDAAAIKQGTGFTFTATVAVKPEVKLGAYKGLKANKMQLEASEDEINSQINQMAEKDSTVSTKEGKIEKGDIAVFDFEGFVDDLAFDGGKAENYELEIGSGQFIPGFEDQMIGMQANDAKDVNVTFPENYQAENLAGKPAVFKVKVHEVKAKSYPELNDEYVAGLGKENITTVAQLKESIKKDIESKKANDEKNRLIEELVAQVSDNSEVSIPTEMVEGEKEQMKEQVKKQAEQYKIDLETFVTITGSNMEQFEKDIEKEATKRVRYNLIIEAIIKAEGMKTTEEQMNAKCEELAKYYNVTVEKIKQFIPAESIEFDINYKNALDLLVNTAELA